MDNPKDNHDKKEEKPHASQEKVITLSEAEYKKLQEEAAKANAHDDRLLRLQADFENARKRMEKQAQDFAKYANEGIILELLLVLDDLERTVSAAEGKNTSPETFLKGIEMILAHLYEMLKEHGLKPVEVIGKQFDPHTSEALMQVESDAPDGTVIEELQRGYWLNDRIIRTAKVKVSKKPDVGTAQCAVPTKG